MSSTWRENVVLPGSNMMWDDLSFGVDLDPVPEAERFPAKPGPSPLDRYGALPTQANDQIPALEDVEEILGTIESRRDEDVALGEQPASPLFYGRTTPMLYADEQANYDWSGGVPYAIYGQAPGFSEYQSVGGTQDLLDISQTHTSFQPVGAESGQATQQLHVIVPDFDLLAGAISPASTYSTVDTKDIDPHSMVGSSGAKTTEQRSEQTDPSVQSGTAQSGTEPKVKQELRETIKKRRKASGKGEIVISCYEKEEGEKEDELTERDLERRRRRRESNRRAAQKSRVKKRQQNMELAKEMSGIAEENERLLLEVDGLRAELAEMTSFVRQHLGVCPQPGNLCQALEVLGNSREPQGSGGPEAANPGAVINPHR